MGAPVLESPLSSCALGNYSSVLCPREQLETCVLHSEQCPTLNEWNVSIIIIILLHVYKISSIHSYHGLEGNYIQSLYLARPEPEIEFWICGGKLKWSQASGPLVHQACITALNPISIDNLPETQWGCSWIQVYDIVCPAGTMCLTHKEWPANVCWTVLNMASLWIRCSLTYSRE